jgi:hypothetical protein
MSRTTAISVLRERIASLEAQLVASHQRYDALVQDVLGMKRDGFVPLQDVPPASNEALKIPPEIDRAILSRAPEGSPEWRELMTFARRELAWETGPEEIAKKILAGSADQIDVEV